MNIVTLKVGELRTNCYIVYDDKKTGIVIDLGDESDKVMKVIEDKSLEIKHIFLTHGHYDHIAAVNDVKAWTDAKVYVHALEERYLFDENFHLSKLAVGKTMDAVGADVLFHDGDKFDVGDFSVKVVHTPGHSLGSCCFIIGTDMFSGDTLFFQSVGRVDLPGSSAEAMMASIKRLKKMKIDYTVYPGHGDNSSLFHEVTHNPYMNGGMTEI